jgi:DNA-binding transcriptional regulator YiaG
VYTKAELFSMAAEQPKEIFSNNITLSAPDDASDCIDLDAEKARLSRIWELAHLSMKELISRTGMTQTSFAKGAGIPLRTVQNWCAGSRDCPAYVRFLLAEHYKLL